VLAFLDFTGDWDPSLAFVMGGAIAAYAPLYRFILRETKPRYVQDFVVFVGHQLDAPLLLGAAVFGVGWGLGGFCPGPALVAAGTGAQPGIIFALSMLAGMAVFQGYDRVLTSVRERDSGAKAG